MKAIDSLMEELPREWKELKWIMSNIKVCQDMNDAKGLDKWSNKLAKWRDSHPTEALVVVKVLMELSKRNMNESN